MSAVLELDPREVKSAIERSRSVILKNWEYINSNLTLTVIPRNKECGTVPFFMRYSEIEKDVADVIVSAHLNG